MQGARRLNPTSLTFTTAVLAYFQCHAFSHHFGGKKEIETTGVLVVGRKDDFHFMKPIDQVIGTQSTVQWIKDTMPLMG